MTEEEKERLKKERADRERLNAVRQMQMQQDGNLDTAAMQERERIRLERHAHMQAIERRQDEFRERQLRELEAQRLQREQQEVEARRIEEERQRFLQEEQAKLQLKLEEEARQQAEAEQQKDDQSEELSEQERRKREFWERQNAKNDEVKKQRLEKERQEQERQRIEQERKRREEEGERRKQISEQAKGFGSFTSDDSNFVEPKGFEQFGEDALYRPKGFKDQQKANAGFNAELPRGFGSFGKEDKPPEGVAGGRRDPFGNQANAGAEASSEAPFRGRPFAPRDMRKAAGSNDIEMLADYLEQRPGWVDKTDKNDWGPIHFAARAGHTQAVEALIRANADVNIRNNQGLTPLAIAVERVGEHHPLTDMLRNNGAEL